MRGNIRYTPNSDEFESTFAVTPGSRGLEPPLKSGNIQQKLQKPQQQHQPQQNQRQQQQQQQRQKHQQPPVQQRQDLRQRVLTDSYQNPIPNQQVSVK